ncbi:hypothetical protein QWZ13_11750 [Reinekea marina]|nr:hypothetical protein [Reinekea marina]MDN3649590.1 hypothetical protein [Reinekea marina]
MVCESVSKVNTDIEYWKWAVIALHNSLQGSMVLALRAGNDFRIMPDKLAEKCLKAHRENKPWPKVKMDNFPNLYKKVKSTEYMHFLTCSKVLPEDEERDRAVTKLLELRNNFIHFMPQGWSLEVSGLPGIFVSLLNMANFLLFESGNVTLYEDDERSRISGAINTALSICSTLRVEYEN